MIGWAILLLLALPVWAATPNFDSLPLVEDCSAVENPLSHGGQWTQAVLGTEPIALFADGLTCSRATGGVNADVGSVWWNVTAYGPDMGVAAVYGDPNNAQANSYTGFYLRLLSPGGAGVDGYFCRFRNTEAAVDLRRIDNATPTTLQTCAAVSVTPGDLIGCAVVGTLFTAHLWTGGVWTEVCSVDITTGSPVYASAGYAGWAMTGNNNLRLDDVRLGTLAPLSEAGEGLLSVMP